MEDRCFNEIDRTSATCKPAAICWLVNLHWSTRQRLRACSMLAKEDKHVLGGTLQTGHADMFFWTRLNEILSRSNADLEVLIKPGYPKISQSTGFIISFTYIKKCHFGGPHPMFKHTPEMGGPAGRQWHTSPSCSTGLHLQHKSWNQKPFCEMMTIDDFLEGQESK